MGIRTELFMRKQSYYPDNTIINNLTRRLDKIDNIKKHLKYKPSLMTYRIQRTKRRIIDG